MSDPTNEHAGAAPAADVPAAGAGPESAAAEPAQEHAAVNTAPDQAVTAQQPAVAAPPAAHAPAAPRGPWYGRRWAVITGAVAAAVILFLGGVAVGDAISDHDRGGFGRDFHAPSRPGGYGQQGWGDNGGGMMPPGMGQGGHGYVHGWDQDGYGSPQAPGATPAPLPIQTTSPQALAQ